MVLSYSVMNVLCILFRIETLWSGFSLGSIPINFLICSSLKTFDFVDMTKLVSCFFAMVFLELSPEFSNIKSTSTLMLQLLLLQAFSMENISRIIYQL